MEIEEMKICLCKFAKDFTKLSEYFGVDDYDDIESKILKTKEIKNQTSNIIKESNEEFNNEKEKENRIIKMNEEVFYGLDDDELEENKNFNFTTRNTINHIGLSSNLKESLRKNCKDDSDLNMKSSNLLNQANNNIYSEELKEIENLSKRGKFYDQAYDNLERKQLPAKRKKINLNVWGILKDAVTKDLSKFCVPGFYLKIFLIFLI
jgi:hypothetical protein